MSRIGPAAVFAGSAYDPSAGGGLLAWQRPGAAALILQGAGAREVPGSHPALGGGRLAWREGEEIVLADAATLSVLARLPAPGADALGLSDALVAWRTRDAAGTDTVWAQPLGGGGPAPLLRAGAPAQLGRPAVTGGRVLCHLAGPSGSRLLAVDAASGAQAVLREDAAAQLSNPATDGARLLYVHATGREQQLRLGPLAPQATASDAVLAVHPSPGRRDREHEPGRHRHRQGYRGRRPALPPRAAPGVSDTLWTTALAPDAAYVTRIRARAGSPRRADILRVPVPPPG